MAGTTHTHVHFEAAGDYSRVHMRVMMFLFLLLTAIAGYAQTVRDNLERLEQDRTQRQQRDATSMAAMAAAAAPHSSWLPPLPAESPCMPIYQVNWDETHSSPNLVLRSLLMVLPGYQDGACLGLESLDRLRKNVDARLFAAGYVTSHVQLLPQDLSTGVLSLRLVLGRVGKVVHRLASGIETDAPHRWLPVLPGDELNLRDIEQGLENAARLPSLAARVAIEPGDSPGFSTLVFVHADAKPWRGHVLVDNQGLDDFGRWQVAAHYIHDLGLLGADQFTVWHQRNAGTSHARLQHRTSLHYSAAWGSQLISFSHTNGQHKRLLQGTTLQFTEAAHDTSSQLQIQKVLWRTGSGRLGARVGAVSRRASNFVQDTELLLQRRRSSALEWGVDTQLRTTAWIGGLRWQRHQVLDNNPRIDLIPEPPPKPRHDSLEVDLQRLTTDSSMGYWASLAMRWVQNPAYGADLPALGGPGSVRGFDGSQQVVGRRSAVLRQDVVFGPRQLQRPGWQARVSVGLDVGQVGELDPSSPSRSRERRLVGAHLGLRGSLPGQQLSAEVSWAKPLSQPSQWPRAHSLYSLQLSGSF